MRKCIFKWVIPYLIRSPAYFFSQIDDIPVPKVRTKEIEFNQEDRYDVNFNATGLASGVYIYRMKVNDFITSKKMILLR